MTFFDDWTRRSWNRDRTHTNDSPINPGRFILAYLRDIQDHADPAIVECVHQVYGEPTPFYTIYEYDRNRRKRDKEPREREG